MIIKCYTLMLILVGLMTVLPFIFIGAMRLFPSKIYQKILDTLFCLAEVALLVPLLYVTLIFFVFSIPSVEKVSVLSFNLFGLLA